MKKFMKIYWGIVAAIAILIAADLLFMIVMYAQYSAIGASNDAQYALPKQPFKYHYSLDDTEYLLNGVSQDEFVARLAELLAQDTVSHYGVSTWKYHTEPSADTVTRSERVLTEEVVVRRPSVDRQKSRRDSNLLLADLPDVFIVDTTVHHARVPSIGYRQSEGTLRSDFDRNDIDTLSVGAFFFVGDEKGPLCYCFSFFVPQDSLGGPCYVKCRFTDRGHKDYEGKELMSVTIVDDQPLRLLMGRNYESMVQDSRFEDYFARHYLDRICEYDRQSFKNAYYSFIDYYMLSNQSLEHLYLVTAPSILLLVLLLVIGLVIKLIWSSLQRCQS